ncbi:MAG: hypothetical protein NWE91_09470 [Candidatus Bathyarchaeota archaeon]|nr:hypothetical protein [Candidatus Bathyarchaeota archaeon]
METRAQMDLVPDSLQLFNAWNIPNRDKRYGLDFKGVIPGQIAENILYYFTEPCMHARHTTFILCEK